MLWQTSSQILITTATGEKNEERRFGAATSNRISVYRNGRKARHGELPPKGAFKVNEGLL
jgi:hypothetical protein